jgi:hypothetical protein
LNKQKLLQANYIQPKMQDNIAKLRQHFHVVVEYTLKKDYGKCMCATDPYGEKIMYEACGGCCTTTRTAYFPLPEDFTLDSISNDGRFLSNSWSKEKQLELLKKLGFSSENVEWIHAIKIEKKELSIKEKMLNKLSQS